MVIGVAFIFLKIVDDREQEMGLGVNRLEMQIKKLVEYNIPLHTK